MEVENLFSSMSDIVEAELHQSQQDSLTSADQQRINGEQVVSILWGEMEVQINQTDETNDVSLSPKTGRKTPEEAGQCEETLWAPHPIACTSSAFSVATVKWDMPDPAVTDSSLANELDLGSLSCTSPTIHQPQDVNDEDFEQEDKEEQDEGELLNSASEHSRTVSEPCDAADLKEPETQIKEDSAHELLERNDDLLEAVPRTDVEEDGEQAVTSAAVETEDLVDSVENICNSEAAFIDLKVEEEEKDRVLLTEREDSEGEQSSESCVENGEESEDGVEVREQQSSPVFSEEEETLVVKEVETEEEEEDKNEPGEQQSVTDVSSEEAEAVSSLRDQQATAEPLQTDNTGTNGTTDNLEEPELLEDIVNSEVPERLNGDLTVQHEKLEVCADADPNVDPEQSDVVEEAPIQEAEITEKIESSPETVELIVNQEETRRECDRLQPEASDQSGQSRDPDQPSDMEPMDQRTQSENTEQPEDPTQPEQTVCFEAEIPEQSEQMGPSEPQTADPPEPELTQSEKKKQAEDVEATDVHRAVGNGAQLQAPDPAEPYMNGDKVDREKACRLAERLFKLENLERGDVVKHIDKDNDFSRAVGEEYLKFFDFTGQTLDQALRSFLKVVVLIGETQERERVLQHFSNRFHQCNPDSYSSPGAVLTLTCALMLLNTDLHGQHVGKSMSSSKFVSNLDGMNEGENFNKDLLKSLYSSIKSEPLQWAVDEEELKNLVEESAGEDAPLRSKANPFQDVPHDKRASVVKEGFLQRKLHMDINGKRTPWGKRGWKAFFGELKGMVLYLQKSDYRRDQTSEEVVSVHHALAERAAEYTKKPNVFRLQTADWRVFLFQASSKVEMNSWISRINLVSALHSSPPFPAAVGSQRKFFRPILPASRSAHPLERQLQFHKQMLESFKGDLSNQEQNVPDSKKAKTRDLDEHRDRMEYLHHEVCRYESYVQVLESWKSVKKMDGSRLSTADLNLFDRAACEDSGEEGKEEEGGLKRSHSSPSLELEIAAPVIKVKRNISERRTYRKPVVPRWNKEA